MPRPAPQPEIFAPPVASPLAEIEASLLALLTATEMHEPDAPAAVAYRSAMRARGQEAFDAGGADALGYLLARIAGDDPSRAEVREAIIETAWAGLPGWHA